MKLLFPLPLATPIVTAWAARQARRILREGEPLSPDQQQVAIAVGVAHPERVRVLSVDHMPFPGGRVVDHIARRLGLPGLNVDGLTLGHAILMRRGSATLRLLAHECRHVAQYEAARSMRHFLLDYLRQVSQHGYADAPLEVDARVAAARWARGEMSKSPELD